MQKSFEFIKAKDVKKPAVAGFSAIYI